MKQNFINTFQRDIEWISETECIVTVHPDYYKNLSKRIIERHGGKVKNKNIEIYGLMHMEEEVHESVFYLQEEHQYTLNKPKIKSSMLSRIKKFFTLRMTILTVFFIVAFIIFNSCGQKGDSGYVKSKADTTFTWITFVAPMDWEKPLNIIHQSYTVGALRYTKDTAYYDTANENSVKRLWKRDTSYSITYTHQLFDTSTKKPLLDTSGKPKVEYYVLKVPKQVILQDYNNDIP